MHRFYLAPNDWSSATLTGSEAHHARDVLRLQPGARVALFDGQGREGTAEISALDSAAVQLRVLHEAVTPPLRARITLAQAIPKGKNMDLIVQKAVEIGAAEIFPLLSGRTVVQLDSESAAQQAGEMADRRARSRQAMRAELAPARAHSAHAATSFFADRRRDPRSTCDLSAPSSRARCI